MKRIRNWLAAVAFAVAAVVLTVLAGRSSRRADAMRHQAAEIEADKTKSIDESRVAREKAKAHAMTANARLKMGRARIEEARNADPSVAAAADRINRRLRGQS